MSQDEAALVIQTRKKPFSVINTYSNNQFKNKLNCINKYLHFPTKWKIWEDDLKVIKDSN